MRFDLDEPLFPPEDALPGLLTALQIDDLEHEWGAAKVDEWCAVAGLGSAANRLRRALGLPAAAPIEYVLTEGARKATADRRVHRALVGYEKAATVYEGARTALADIRRRAHVATAA